MKLRHLPDLIFLILIAVLLLQRSELPPADKLERVRAYTRTLEFDYVDWTLDALVNKIFQSTLGIQNFQTENRQKEMILSCLSLTTTLDEIDQQIESIYANPKITNPAQSAAVLLSRQKQLQGSQHQNAPLCESILQQQISAVLADLHLTFSGQPVPPVLYSVTPLPMALIVSPRNIIRQDANISLLVDMSLEEITTLEERVERSLNVSALVVPIGGVGIYPTMVMSTDDLPYLVDTIAHEWIHNYLTLRPLGLSYDNTPELRTMNETAASLAGGEIGREVLKRYYPEFLPPQSLPISIDPNLEEENQIPTQTQIPPVFSYRKEMNTTRITVDKLLKENKIEEAEQYLADRRRFFWENGYQIRKLNQAYFAFYGAYADSPGGAAGKDPVGPAVRSLRTKSSSLAEFINRISWMTSFQDLEKTIKP